MDINTLRRIANQIGAISVSDEPGLVRVISHIPSLVREATTSPHSMAELLVAANVGITQTHGVLHPNRLFHASPRLTAEDVTGGVLFALAHVKPHHSAGTVIEHPAGVVRLVYLSPEEGQSRIVPIVGSDEAAAAERGLLAIDAEAALRQQKIAGVIGFLQSLLGNLEASVGPESDVTIERLREFLLNASQAIGDTPGLTLHDILAGNLATKQFEAAQLLFELVAAAVHHGGAESLQAAIAEHYPDTAGSD